VGAARLPQIAGIFNIPIAALFGPMPMHRMEKRRSETLRR